MIELGITQDQWEKEVLPPLIPTATYEFVVDHIDDTDSNGAPLRSKGGQPMWCWHLKITSPSQMTTANGDVVKTEGRILRNYTLLPFYNQQTGGIDLTNTFGLFNILKEVGVPMVGTKIPEKEVFFGSGGFVVVGQEPRRDNPELISNTVKFPRRKGGIIH